MERYRITEDGAVYFVTMSVVEWLPIFVAEEPCQIVTESLNFCHDRKGLRVNSYVIMPTHLHAIVFYERSDPLALKATLIDFRKFTGRRLADYCSRRTPPCFEESLARSSSGDRERRFWQPTMHPERIENERFYVQKRDYLHDNPCRKGLVIRPQHWRFSSASAFFSDSPVSNDVKLTPIQW